MEPVLGCQPQTRLFQIKPESYPQANPVALNYRVAWAWKFILINKPRHLQKHWFRSLSQMFVPSLTCLFSSSQALMRTWTFLRCKDRVVIVCRRLLVLTPFPIPAPLSGSCYNVMVSHWRWGVGVCVCLSCPASIGALFSLLPPYPS